MHTRARTTAALGTTALGTAALGTAAPGASRPSGAAAQAMLRAAGSLLPLGLFVNDSRGQPTYVNPALLELLEASGEDPAAERSAAWWQEAIHPDDRESLRGIWDDCVQTGQTYRSCHRFVKRGGDVVFADVVVAPIFGPAGRAHGLAGTLQSMTPAPRLSDAELALRRSEQHYRQIVDTAQEGVWLRDADARTTFVNRRLCDMLGYTASEMLGRLVSDFMDPGSHADAERRFEQRRRGESQQHDVRYRHKNGSEVWAIVSASPMFEDGVFVGSLGMITDITDRKRHEETIRWQAYHDSLTKLPNRRLLEDRLHQLLAGTARTGGQAAVLFIDLDRFKQVNDTLGHEFGDRLLTIVAGRIAGCLRAEDTVARVGGDEFTALLPGIERPEAAALAAQKLLAVLAQPVEIAGQEVFVSGSIGVSLHPSDGDDAASLLKHADAAMYRAKEQGGNSFCLFSQSMSAHALENLTLESSLRRALRHDEFHLVFQPQVDLDTGEIETVEALCRWQHPEQGVIPPHQFIPLAEASGLIVPLGAWVLRAACRQAAQWHEAGHPLRVAVNLSARQLAQPGLPHLVRSILADTGLPAHWLELELTESALMKNAQSAVDVLHALRRLGVRLALDDFGTGYSSLAYLRQFHFDVLKIDRSFVANIVDDKVDQALVRAMIDLSQALDLAVVVEGVECDPQRRVLQSLGCRVIQGFLFSPPVLPGRLPALRRRLRAA